jgi:DinB superfamily
MSIAQSIFAEFAEQAPITRRFLERLPEDRLTWKPHEKSMSAGQLALHIARVPGGVVRFVQNNPAQAPDFKNVPQPSNLQEVLNTFEESIATVRSLLPQFNDANMQETWRMVQGDREVLAIPRAQFIRDIMLNQLVSAPGTVQRLLAPAQRGSSGKLGTQRRRSPHIHSAEEAVSLEPYRRIGAAYQFLEIG